MAFCAVQHSRLCDAARDVLDLVDSRYGRQATLPSQSIRQEPQRGRAFRYGLDMP